MKVYFFDFVMIIFRIRFFTHLLFFGAMLTGNMAAEGQDMNARQLSMSDYVNQGIKATFNVDYIPSTDYANNKDKLDIFIPQQNTPCPVIVFFHGGALMEGDKQFEVKSSLKFPRNGIGIVIVNYRLSPGVSHPAHMEDAAASVAWVKRNIASYGGDPNQLYLSGHSAGAYLAVLLSLDSRYLSAEGMSLSDIAGTMGISPFLYVEETAKERDKSVWGTNEATWKAASVSPYISSGKPPMLLLYADGDDDWRKRHNEDLAAGLRKFGNRVEVDEIQDRDHSSIWTSIDRRGDKVSQRMIDFVLKP